MDFVGRNSIADPGGIVEALLAAIHVTPGGNKKLDLVDEAFQRHCGDMTSHR